MAPCLPWLRTPPFTGLAIGASKIRMCFRLQRLQGWGGGDIGLCLSLGRSCAWLAALAHFLHNGTDGVPSIERINMHVHLMRCNHGVGVRHGGQKQKGLFECDNNHLDWMSWGMTGVKGWRACTLPQATQYSCRKAVYGCLGIVHLHRLGS